MHDPADPSPGCDASSPACHSRRQFMKIGGAGAALVALGELFPGRVFPEDAEVQARFAAYPRMKLDVKLSDLPQDEPVEICYPGFGPHDHAFLVKLGRKAGGGIGPEQDVVAFNSLCTHMGGDLSGEYDKRYKIAGPCPEHLTSFDLTRHGMVVAGHATSPLPQVVLESDGDDIYAIGVLGLIYGYHKNIDA